MYVDPRRSSISEVTLLRSAPEELKEEEDGTTSSASRLSESDLSMD